MEPDTITAFEKKRRRRAVVLGFAGVVGGLWFTSLAWDAIRTGRPIPMLNAPALEGWPALGIGVLAVLIGLGVMGLGFGWIKPRT